MQNLDTDLRAEIVELRELASKRPLRVALAATCLVDTLYPRVAKATAQIVERLGHTVIVPKSKTCCGQMHVNSGYPREACSVLAQHVTTLERESWDAVVSPSGSCVGSLRHQGEMVAQMSSDGSLGGRVASLADRTFDLSEFLVDVLQVRDVGASYPHRVTYHPTCHAARILRVGDKPLELLRNVHGIELIELPSASECCGFGGTFAMKNSAVSTAIVDDKIDNVVVTGASVLVAGDASCLMHIGGRMDRRDVNVRTIHLAEILAARQ